MAANRVTINTIAGFDEVNDRRRTVNGLPVEAMGPENVVVLGADVDYPVQVVPYSGGYYFLCLMTSFKNPRPFKFFNFYSS